MVKSKRPRSGGLTFHADGTVSLLYGEAWVRGRDPSAGLLDSLDDGERERVLIHIGAVEAEPLEAGALRAALRHRKQTQAAGPRTMRELAGEAGISESGLRAWVCLGEVPPAPAHKIRRVLGLL
jgi:hypothetical protein